MIYKHLLEDGKYISPFTTSPRQKSPVAARQLATAEHADSCHEKQDLLHIVQPESGMATGAGRMKSVKSPWSEVHLKS